MILLHCVLELRDIPFGILGQASLFLPHEPHPPSPSGHRIHLSEPTCEASQNLPGRTAFCRRGEGGCRVWLRPHALPALASLPGNLGQRSGSAVPAAPLGEQSGCRSPMPPCACSA